VGPTTLLPTVMAGTPVPSGSTSGVSDTKHRKYSSFSPKLRSVTVRPVVKTFVQGPLGEVDEYQVYEGVPLTANVGSGTASETLNVLLLPFPDTVYLPDALGGVITDASIMVVSEVRAGYAPPSGAAPTAVTSTTYRENGARAI